MSGAVVRILDDHVVNQIAAGEVVERPVSVVKELVENSIDAGATEISVSIANGGRSSIEVLDNGSGMSKDDALLAIERFGTSKIRSADDLQAVATHGFRGEALPSIASVSKLRLSSALEGAGGVRLSIHGGTIREVTDAALRKGTAIEVQHLFYNVPARRKFLRTENTEAGLVRALMIDFALAYPSVRFRLTIDGASAADYPPGRDFFARAKELALAGERPIMAEERMQIASGEVCCRAFLSQPVECVSSSGRLRLLVNRRPVRDRILLKAVRDGFGNFLRPGRYPSGVVALDMPPGEVDVNVHPQKTEVRFRRPEIVFSVVGKAVGRALGTLTPAMLGEPRTPEVRSPFVLSDELEPLRNTPAPSGGPQLSLYSQLAPQAVIDSALTAGASARSSREDLPLCHYRYVGQLLGCYLVLEGEGKVAMVDMHAAHERVMFYRIKTQLLAGAVHSQMLLIPETVALAPDRLEDFERFRDALLRLGIEADRISDREIAVRSVPALLRGISAAKIFAELSALGEWSDWGAEVERFWDHAIARLACHRSVRSGRELEAPEVYELLEALAEADASGYCPHGRPIVKRLELKDFEAMFGRDV